MGECVCDWSMCLYWIYLFIFCCIELHLGFVLSKWCYVRVLSLSLSQCSQYWNSPKGKGQISAFSTTSITNFRVCFLFFCLKCLKFKLTLNNNVNESKLSDFLYIYPLNIGLKRFLYRFLHDVSITALLYLKMLDLFQYTVHKSVISVWLSKWLQRLIQSFDVWSSMGVCVCVRMTTKLVRLMQVNRVTSCIETIMIGISFNYALYLRV